MTKAIRMAGSLALLFLSACAHPAPPALPAHPALPALAQLTKDLDAIVTQPAFDHTYWAIGVKSLETDETIYALNARKLMMPASYMKIVTLASPASTLAWNSTDESTDPAAGPIQDDVLRCTVVD